MRLLILFVLVLLSGSGPCRKGTMTRPGDEVAVRGTLTAEGVECPALRDETGKLYTLAGSLGAFKQGDSVCVRGRIAEVSTCMQGVTISVESIRPASECR